MTWKSLLEESMHYNYAVAENLIKMVADDELGWKPATGYNWLTVGQLLYHIPEACGFCCKGFVTGDWGLPADFDPSSQPDMLPSAASMKSVGSVAEALERLAADKTVALEMLGSVSEEELENRIAPAPWDSMQFCLGRRMLEMVTHLQQHKGQLFYYLKLMGKDVNTMHLWGA